MQKNRIVLIALALVLVGTSLQAAMVQKMDLGEVCARAERIFRGTVVGISQGEVEAGGGAGGFLARNEGGSLPELGTEVEAGQVVGRFRIPFLGSERAEWESARLNWRTLRRTALSSR